MTAEELRDKLSEFIENNPDCKDKDIALKYFDFEYSVNRYLKIADVSLDTTPCEKHSLVVVEGRILMGITDREFTKANKQAYVSALHSAGKRLAMIHEFILSQGVLCDDDNDDMDVICDCLDNAEDVLQDLICRVKCRVASDED